MNDKELDRHGLWQKVKRSTPRGDVEHQHQVALFKWAKRVGSQYRGLDLMFAIPNGGYRGHREGSRLKDEGVRAGVPDIFLPVPLGGYAGLWIEMKTSKGCLSPEQRVYLSRLDAEGYKVEVARGYPAAVKAIDSYYSTD